MAQLIHPRTAFTQILAQINPLQRIESVVLQQSLGRVLAGDYTAQYASPQADLSAMDGYAVAYQPSYLTGTALRLIGTARAGQAFDGVVGPGQAVRIFTGGIVPKGADTIIIQENTQTDNDIITLTEPARPNQFIRPKGLDFPKGAVIAGPQTIHPRLMGMLAVFGQKRVRVLARPRVLILTSGDELIMPDKKPEPQQIIASNLYLIAGMVQQMGGVADIAPILPDNKEIIGEKLQNIQQYDLVVTIGGASVGDFDFIYPVLQQLQANITIAKMALRPGKPIIFAKIGQRPVLCLPGNPVSSFMGGLILLQPILQKMQNQDYAYFEDTAKEATLGGDIPANDHRLELLRANWADGVATPLAKQDSSMQFALNRANCLIIRPIHSPPMTSGQTIKIINLESSL